MKKIFYTFTVCLCLFWISGWSVAQVPRGRLPMSRTETLDSLEAIHLLTGHTGTVAFGVPGFLDTTGTISTAHYDEPYLNLGTLGFGTNIAGQLKISGIISVGWATEVGKIYWLQNGTLITTRPTASNVWRAEMGRCTRTGEFHINVKKPIRGDYQ